MWNNLYYESPKKAFYGLIHHFLRQNQVSMLASRGFLNNLIINIENPIRDLSLGEVHFQPARWKRFLTEYIDEKSFVKFARLAQSIKPGQETGYSAPVRARHIHGNCFIGLSYGGKPLTLTMYSRASLIYPTGALDLAFLAAVADLLKVKQASWIVSSMYMSSIRSLPLLSHIPELTQYAQDYPNNKLVQNLRKEQLKVVNSPEKFTESLFGPRKRAFKKFVALSQGETWPEYIPQITLG